jgi:hypothetical protein
VSAGVGCDGGRRLEGPWNVGCFSFRHSDFGLLSSLDISSFVIKKALPDFRPARLLVLGNWAWQS